MNEIVILAQASDGGPVVERVVEPLETGESGVDLLRFKAKAHAVEDGWRVWWTTPVSFRARKTYPVGLRKDRFFYLREG